MSRTSLHRPRHTRAACHRPATGTRLLPSPFPSTIPQLNYHYKRCPKAQRLRLRSDQSPSRPLYGRSPDKSRHPLSKGHCQVRAPLTRRIRLASSGDALEHGVMSLHRAIVPCSDSPGADHAGRSEQSDNLRLKTNAPYKDSTVVTTGELPTTNAGHGSTLPSLGVVEHFWWTGLPHTENFSGLVHIPSEVRGCRRAVADVEHPLERTPRIGTGVDAFSRNRPGPSITSPSPSRLLRHSRPRSFIHPRKGRVSAPRGILYFPTHPLNHVIPMPCEESGVGLPSPLSHPRFSLRHSRLRSRIHSLPIPGVPTPEKTKFPRKQSKPTTAPAHQSKLPLPTSNKGAARPLDPIIFDRHKR